MKLTTIEIHRRLNLALAVAVLGLWAYGLWTVL
jgi:hypothetical protein